MNEINPMESLNQEAIPSNQAVNYGAVPVQSMQQPKQVRALDADALIPKFSSPGADFGSSALLKADKMFHSSGSRQAVMNIGTPLEANAFIGALQSAKQKGESTFTVGDKTFNVK